MSGKDPIPQVLAYEGVRSVNPPNLVKSKVNPTSANTKFALGTFWLNTVTGALFCLQTAPGGWLQVQSGTVSTATGAAASPLALNTRIGQATFTSVSIAAAATLSLTITNTAILSSSTVIAYSLSGVTTGAALTIQSITNTTGQSVVVITNGTGASTSTANIVLTFQILN